MKIIVLLIMMCGQLDTTIAWYPNGQQIAYKRGTFSNINIRTYQLLQQNPVIITYEIEGICT